MGRWDNKEKLLASSNPVLGSSPRPSLALRGRGGRIKIKRQGINLSYNENIKNFKASPKQKSNYQKILSTFEKRRNKDWLLGKIQSSPRLRKSRLAKKPSV